MIDKCTDCLLWYKFFFNTDNLLLEDVENIAVIVIVQMFGVFVIWVVEYVETPAVYMFDNNERKTTLLTLSIVLGITAITGAIIISCLNLNCFK